MLLSLRPYNLRRTLRSLVVGVLLIGAIPAPRALAKDARVEELARTLANDRSEKARIAAVVALGNLGEARGVPALIHALADRSAVVRALAASALGHIADDQAIPALERALGDDNDNVRARAREALTLIRSGAPVDIDPGDEVMITKVRMTAKEAPRKSSVGAGRSAKLYIVVKDMGAKTHVSKELTSRMKTIVLADLGRTPELTLDSAGSGKLTQFVVDGSITRLSQQANGPWVEITCEVKLTISNSHGSILSMVSGGATVQTARASFKRELSAELELEAMENAVHGAHQNLIGFLFKQIASN